MDTNAVAGQTNYYELSARTGCGTSANSVALAVYLPVPVRGLRASGQTLTLSWPGWANDWVLYGTTNLDQPVVWVPVTNAPGSNSGRFNVRLPLDGLTRFFQLAPEGDWETKDLNRSKRRKPGPKRHSETPYVVSYADGGVLLMDRRGQAMGAEGNGRWG